MIQRELKERRSNEIAKYLTKKPDRLFNALVVATYGGEPCWHALTNVQNRGSANELSCLTDDTMLSVGFLTLRGDEQLFALDGQHRLSGIKKVVRDVDASGLEDIVPIMFVAHEKTSQGLRRTRRLFTTLNKTAKPTSKFDIIALDEDDVMAITVRRLIDENPELFGSNRVALVGSSSMPTSNFSSLITIVNLYDILRILYTQARTPLKRPPAKLRNSRPDDKQLDSYYKLALRLFKELKDGFPELATFFSAVDTQPVVRKYRYENALFRPAGLIVFVTILARLTSEMSLRDAVKKTAKLPRRLDTKPFEGLMWNRNTQTIRRFKSGTLLELLLHMLGRSQVGEEKLLQRYRNEVGDQLLQLPARVVRE